MLDFGFEEGISAGARHCCFMPGIQNASPLHHNHHQRGEHMTILTLAAIAESPWNAVAYDLPTDADRALLEATYSAAQQCVAKEYGLMNAALAGSHISRGQTGEEAEALDGEEDYEERWFDAARRVVLAPEQYWHAFQARIDDPDDEAAEE
jgi:hypothetical protein